MDTSKIEAKLVERLKELLGRSGRLTDHLRDTPPSDWEELATFREGDEVAEALDDLTRREIEEIKQALRRLAAGEWQYCDSCGEEIAAARLEALPTTRLCIRCAAARARDA